MVSSYSPSSMGLMLVVVLAFVVDNSRSFAPPSSLSTHSTTSPLVLFGKKNKRKGGGGGGGGGGGKNGGGQQPRQEKQSVKDQRFDAETRQFMFTLTGLTKLLPDKSKKILDNIYLSFYPGAKIGIVGLNGSGWVRSTKRINYITMCTTKFPVRSLDLTFSPCALLLLSNQKSNKKQ